MCDGCGGNVECHGMIIFMHIYKYKLLRLLFQNICHEVDTKREDMKWLVQTLDSLVSHCSDKESLTEQKRLEQLITRYKNLIPTIELTMVKTDVHYKCYTYRKEVREVCKKLYRMSSESVPGLT